MKRWGEEALCLQAMRLLLNGHPATQSYWRMVKHGQCGSRKPFCFWTHAALRSMLGHTLM